VTPIHIELKTWCTFTIIVSSYKNDLVLTPLHYMRRICCLKINVNESLDKGDILEEDPLMSNGDED